MRIKCGIKKPRITYHGDARLNQQGKTQGFCYSITHTDISVVDDQVYIGEVYGPLFGRGASCYLELKNGVASFENPVEEWIS